MTSGVFICFVYVSYGVRVPGSECVWYYINYLQRLLLSLCTFWSHLITWGGIFFVSAVNSVFEFYYSICNYLIWRVFVSSLSDTMIFYDSLGSLLIELFNSFYSVLDSVVRGQLYSSPAAFAGLPCSLWAIPDYLIPDTEADFLPVIFVDFLWHVYTSDKFGLAITKAFVAWRPVGATSCFTLSDLLVPDK